jgi:pimeloyl-ACP methyl ester carboxylesterase
MAPAVWARGRISEEERAAIAKRTPLIDFAWATRQVESVRPAQQHRREEKWPHIENPTKTVPALYVAGDRDLVVRFPGMDQLIPNLAKFVPRLSRTVMLPGCGHWTQQERPAEVNAAMLEFLERL